MGMIGCWPFLFRPKGKTTRHSNGTTIKRQGQIFHDTIPIIMSVSQPSVASSTASSSRYETNTPSYNPSTPEPVSPESTTKRSSPILPSVSSFLPPPTYDRVPVLYSEQKNRFIHFADTLYHFSRPKAHIFVSVADQLKLTSSVLENRRICVYFTMQQIKEAEFIRTLFLYEKLMYAVVICVDIELVMGLYRTEEYYVLGNWCKSRQIMLGCYVYQRHTVLEQHDGEYMTEL